MGGTRVCACVRVYECMQVYACVSRVAMTVNALLPVVTTPIRVLIRVDNKQHFLSVLMLMKYETNFQITD